MPSADIMAFHFTVVALVTLGSFKNMAIAELWAIRLGGMGQVQYIHCCDPTSMAIMLGNAWWKCIACNMQMCDASADVARPLWHALLQ